ncbi:MAG TPA: hypothetical protein VHX20_14460 [Terracidiphilus sp.]|nr:hypothetical protein [Terracidiphilus sp.]
MPENLLALTGLKNRIPWYTVESRPALSPPMMGHSSLAVAARYYIHFTETHVAAGFGKFVEYQTRNVAEAIAVAFPQASEAVQ